MKSGKWDMNRVLYFRSCC